MAKTFTYKVRAGNAIPILCDAPTDPSEGNIIFTFGTETQEVISCSSDKNIIKSSDMCLLGGQYFSAQYRALPGKIDGKLVFTSVLTKKPVRTNTYPNTCGGNTSGGGTPSIGF